MSGYAASPKPFHYPSSQKENISPIIMNHQRWVESEQQEDIFDWEYKKHHNNNPISIYSDEKEGTEVDEANSSYSKQQQQQQEQQQYNDPPPQYQKQSHKLSDVSSFIPL
jgi:hypothetical protein